MKTYDYFCAECEGGDVQILAWVDPNTDKVLEYPEGSHHTWCTDCEDHTKIKTKDET